MSKGYHRLPGAEPWSNRARGSQPRDIALHGEPDLAGKAEPVFTHSTSEGVSGTAVNRPTRIDREAPTPVVDFEPGPRKMTREEARASGYTGDVCTACQSPQVKRNGSCLVCESCGQTTGCS